MSYKSFLAVMIVLAILNWLDFISDRTAMWLFIFIGALGVASSLEGKLNNFEYRISELEDKFPDREIPEY